MTKFIPTERDKGFIRLVARYRMMDADQLTALLPGSSEHMRRRLRLLAEHGYLERLHAHATSMSDLRNRPRVYALGQAGAALLSLSDDVPLQHVRWQLKNARAGYLFINHTLAVADVMIHVLRAADTLGWTVVDHFDLRSSFPPATDLRRKRNPFSLTLRLDGEEHPLVPDRLFSLHQGEQRLNFALEADRGTEPVHRSLADSGSHLTQKIRLYWQAWLDKAHQEAWAFRQFRVLSVLPSDARIATLQGKVAKHRLVSNPSTQLFLFTTPERLAAEGPLSPIWQTIAPGPAISPLGSVPQPFATAER